MSVFTWKIEKWNYGKFLEATTHCNMLISTNFWQGHRREKRFTSACSPSEIINLILEATRPLGSDHQKKIIRYSYFLLFPCSCCSNQIDCINLPMYVEFVRKGSRLLGSLLPNSSIRLCSFKLLNSFLHIELMSTLRLRFNASKQDSCKWFSCFQRTLQ